MTHGVQQDLREKRLLDQAKIVIGIEEHAENACKCNKDKRIVDHIRANLDIQLLDWQNTLFCRHGKEEEDEKRQTADHANEMSLEVLVNR